MALSTCEAEVVATSACCKDLMHLHHFAEDLQLWDEGGDKTHDVTRSDIRVPGHPFVLPTTSS
eukprot:9757229-Ditylum_brightwellii.AAC.1